MHAGPLIHSGLPVRHGGAPLKDVCALLRGTGPSWSVRMVQPMRLATDRVLQSLATSSVTLHENTHSGICFGDLACARPFGSLPRQVIQAELDYFRDSCTHRA